jgi:hypothetical protein
MIKRVYKSKKYAHKRGTTNHTSYGENTREFEIAVLPDIANTSPYTEELQTKVSTI